MFGRQKAPDQPCTAVKDEAFLYGHHRTTPQVNRQVLAARHKEDTTGFDLMTEMIFGTAPELWGNLDFRPFLRQSASHPRSHKTGGPFRFVVATRRISNKIKQHPAMGALPEPHVRHGDLRPARDAHSPGDRARYRWQRM